jgi:microcin C transport system substrate-binding protein
MEEIIRLARQIVRWVHDDAAFIPAFVEPFYRTAYWRWVQWPEAFNVRTSRDWEEYYLFWIDPAVRTGTLEAMKDGRTFTPVNRVYDQFRTR